MPSSCFERLRRPVSGYKCSRRLSSVALHNTTYLKRSLLRQALIILSIERSEQGFSNRPSSHLSWTLILNLTVLNLSHLSTREAPLAPVPE